MASTVLDPVAERIKAKLAELNVITADERHKWAPASIGVLPAGVIEMPTIARTSPGQAESQLGSNDWTLTFPVTLYFELDEATAAQTQATETVEAFIKAIDDDPSLGDPSIIEDAKVILAAPSILDDDARAMIAYDCELQIVKLV
jgi:hypothetical protein